jgi:hypothetical protein
VTITSFRIKSSKCAMTLEWSTIIELFSKAMMNCFNLMTEEIPISCNSNPLLPATAAEADLRYATDQ